MIAMCRRSGRCIRSSIIPRTSMRSAIISAECQNAQEAEQLAAFIANRYPQAQTAVNRNSIDISAKGVNKATALSAIARHFHIDPSQVAAIGDGRNDLCLLERSMVLPSAAIRCWKQQQDTRWMTSQRRSPSCTIDPHATQIQTTGGQYGSKCKAGDHSRRIF